MPPRRFRKHSFQDITASSRPSFPGKPAACCSKHRAWHVQSPTHRGRGRTPWLDVILCVPPSSRNCTCLPSFCHSLQIRGNCVLLPLQIPAMPVPSGHLGAQGTSTATGVVTAKMVLSSPTPLFLISATGMQPQTAPLSDPGGGSLSALRASFCSSQPTCRLQAACRSPSQEKTGRSTRP